MLKHFKNHYITHSKYYHLGDIINIVQQIHHRSLAEPGLFYMFSKSRCPCCGINTGKMMRQTIDLLDTKITFLKEIPPQYKHATPAWVPDHMKTIYDDLPYTKAKNLPKRNKYTVCQFDGRSQGEKVPPRKSINKFITDKMVNIGDNKLPCVNKTQLDLLAKFHLIASAKLYIGIDSGLTHLALMTETPILLIHPKEWPARKYYPKTNQIEFISV